MSKVHIGIFRWEKPGYGGAIKRTMTIAEHFAKRFAVTLFIHDVHAWQQRQHFFGVDLSQVDLVALRPLPRPFQHPLWQQTRWGRQLYQAVNPELSRRLPDLNFVEPMCTISNYSYHVRQFTGKGFLCVGDAHRFIDPIFSFGVYFATKEAALAAQAIQQTLDSERQPDGNPFADYQALAEQGQNVIHDLLDCFWTYLLIFLIFAHYQYREGLIDLFAGRIYNADVEQMPIAQAVRQRLKPQTEASTTKEQFR